MNSLDILPIKSNKVNSKIEASLTCIQNSVKTPKPKEWISKTPKRKEKNIAGIIIKLYSFLSITLNTSVCDSCLASEWYTNILGKYKSPAIQDITAIRCNDLNNRYKFIL